MATYSSNTTIKVGSSIAQVASNGGSFSYTVPSGSYAMLTSLYMAGGFSGTGQIQITAPNSHSIYNNTETSGNTQFENYSSAPLYLPSGTVISGITTGAVLGGTASMNAILFQNTP